MTSHASSTDHPPVALTIGNFDGVHLGHQALIRGARARVGDTGRVIALCFHPHPMVALNPEHAPLPIEPYAIRARRLMALGVDEVVCWKNGAKPMLNGALSEARNLPSSSPSTRPPICRFPSKSKTESWTC